MSRWKTSRNLQKHIAYLTFLYTAHMENRIFIINRLKSLFSYSLSASNDENKTYLFGWQRVLQIKWKKCVFFCFLFRADDRHQHHLHISCSISFTSWVPNMSIEHWAIDFTHTFMTRLSDPCEISNTGWNSDWFANQCLHLCKQW